MNLYFQVISILQLSNNKLMLALIFLIFFLLSLIEYIPVADNSCVFSIQQPNSTAYMLKIQQLHRVRDHVPSLLPPPTLKIPTILFQTNQNYQVPLAMYQTIQNNIQMNPHFTYRFYNSQDRRNFMRQMGERYLNVYDTLRPPAYKADVFRYSVIYHYGGCYMDAGSYTVRPLVEFLRPADEFVSSDDSNGNGLNSAFFCAVKGHRVLQYAIENIFQAVQNREYGNNELDITGPYKFLEGMGKYLRETGLKVVPKDYGDGLRILWRQHQVPCLIAVIRDGQQPVILSKYPAYIGDMRRYTGKQRYANAWSKREVFSQGGSQIYLL